MIKYDVVKVYAWFDILAAICDDMGITTEEFRDLNGTDKHFNSWCDSRGYGNVDDRGFDRGSSHMWFKEYNDAPDGIVQRPPSCDLWHVARYVVVPDHMANDSIVTMFAIEDLDEELETYIEDHGEWAIPFFVSYNKIMSSIDPNYEGIEVKFSW